MILTGEEIHRGGIRPETGTTKIRVIVRGAYSDDEMRERIKKEWQDLDGLVQETIRTRVPRACAPSANGSSGSSAEAEGSSRPAGRPASRRFGPADPRLLARLGKLDEARLDSRITSDEYWEMRGRAEQEFGAFPQPGNWPDGEAEFDESEHGFDGDNGPGFSDREET